MGSIALFARRVIIVGGFAITAAAPVVGVTLVAPANPHTHLADCPTGEEQDLYSGQCTPYLVPNSPGSAPASAPASTPADADTTGASPGMCPPGVSGAECGGSTGGEASSPEPRMPAQVPPQEPEEELAEVVTPGY